MDSKDWIKVTYAIQAKEEQKERKSDQRFHIICHVMAGANLAAGNVPGWLVCTGISGAYHLVRCVQRRK